MSPELVIFDCDGVLVDSERLVNAIEARLLSELGLEISPEEARAAFKGRTVAEIVTLVEGRLGAPLPPGWLYDHGTATALGFARELRAVAGVRDVLAGLGIATCVASQAPRPRVELALHVTGLAPFFGDRVWTAARVPRAKPAPDLFLYAAARMGVPPARAVVVEDSASGVQAAVAAGMTALGYAADEEPGTLERAGAVVFTSMGELPLLLRDLPSPRPVPDSSNRVREIYERFAAGDPGPMAAFLASDVAYHLPGRHLGGGTLRGRDAVFARLLAAAGECEAPPQLEVRGLAGAGDVVLSVERFAARRRGRTLDQEVAVVWRLAGGQCVEIWSRFADQGACDRFWMPA